MPTPRTRSSSSAMLKASVIFLCAAIFLWGLRYKLTPLTTPHSPAKNATFAKLIRDRELNKRSWTTGTTQEHNTQETALIEALAPVLPTLCATLRLQLDVRASIEPPLLLPALWMRPPPASA